MIDDHQAAEPRKHVRKRNRAIVDGLDRQAFGAGDIDPVVHAATGVGNPKPLSQCPGQRPIQVAAEGANRKGGRRATRETGDGRLQILLRREQLARQLRVQIATLIDLSNQGVPRIEHPIGLEARALGLRFEGRQFGLLLGHGLA